MEKYENRKACYNPSRIVKDLTIAGIIASHAIRRPHRSAILSEDRIPLSYERLFQHICEVIGALNSIGIGRKKRVALVLPNSPEAATAFLSVSSGASSVPLNSAYRSAEYERYLFDSNIDAVIVHAGHDSEVRSVAMQKGIRIIELGPDPVVAGLFSLEVNGTRLVAQRDSTPQFAQFDDEALVLSTSGTTSRPKNVTITHEHLAEFSSVLCQCLGLTERDRCLNVMPMFHAHGLKACLSSTIRAGAGIFCTSGFEAPKFFSLLERSEATWYSAVPTIHQAILARTKLDDREYDISRLRLIRSTSAALPPCVCEDLENVFGVPVIESYALTEVSHLIACTNFPTGVKKPGSVGQSVGVEIAIMDQVGSLLEANVSGEIVLRGEDVACGYIDDPNVNAAPFLNGWFRTGDLGFLDEDGFLFITGRLKEVINRGGEMISPHEIEDILLRHPAVRQAVTFAMPDSQLGDELAAAIVVNDDIAIGERELQVYASEFLADFKVPRRILFLDELAKGPTGKLKRIGLAEDLGLVSSPVRTNNGRHVDADVVRNYRTLTEARVARIWADAFGVPEVAVEENFLSLGGDSIQAGQIRLKINDEFGIELSFVDFFGSPTVRQLSKRIDEYPARVTQDAVS